jgi:probable HAF family extracellular repeat protein
MKITHSSTIQSLLLAAVLGSGLGFVSPVSAQQVSSYIVDSNGKGLADLGSLGGGYSGARGINDVGQVIGDSRTASGQDHAFITGPNGVDMTDLGTLNRLGDSSSASGINDAGQVVGNFFPGRESSLHAFITGPNGVGMTDLGTLIGVEGYLMSASDINNAGRAVGESGRDSGSSQAFITGPNGVGMTDLGTLGGDSSSALGTNDAGQVVGWSYTAAGDQHAFITGPNGVGMTDLNSLVSLPGGGVLTTATGINNNGQVPAVGSFIPEPKTYAMLLGGLGLLGFIAHRRKTA